MVLLKLAAGLAVAILLGFVALRLLERVLVFHPFRRMDAAVTDAAPRGEEAWFTAADGVRLHAWFLPAPAEAPPERARLAVLVAHGNGGNLSHRLDLYRALLGLGVNVLAFDYRGYGRSAGRPTEEGTYRDAGAALAWLEARGFARTNVIALGESLGGGVAAELARRAPGLGGLVLQSSFTSIPDVGAERLPLLLPRLTAGIRYDTRAKLPALAVPLLVLHGRADTLIGFHHAAANFAAAQGPKLLREVAGDHNDVPAADPAGYAAAWAEFLGRHWPRR
jgi:hypothetical protein